MVWLGSERPSRGGSVRNARFEQDAGGAVALIALVAMLSGAVVVSAMGRQKAVVEGRRLAHATMSETDALLTAMLNQETGLRGYAITGRPTSLEPYHWGRDTLDGVVPRLRLDTASHPDEAALLDGAVAAARAWQDEIAFLRYSQAAVGSVPITPRVP